MGRLRNHAIDRVAFVAPAAIAWECYEVATHISEYPTNRVIDVLLAVAGWFSLDAVLPPEEPAPPAERSEHALPTAAAA